MSQSARRRRGGRGGRGASRPTSSAPRPSSSSNPGPGPVSPASRPPPASAPAPQAHDHDHTHDHDSDSDDDEHAEQLALDHVLTSLARYAAVVGRMPARKRAALERIPAHHAALLNEHAAFTRNLDAVDAGITANDQFFRAVLKADPTMLAGYLARMRRMGSATAPEPQPADVDKAVSTLKQVARDWSAEGAPERAKCYQPMIDALVGEFVNIEERSSRRVLIPGAGLGRLVWEVAKLGFASEGNEFSFHMLLVSNYLLNGITLPEQHTLYPYVHTLSNSLNFTTDQVRPVAVPDVLPSSLPDGADMSMVAGDFVEVYSSPTYTAAFDSVLTCFFLDTAHNIVEYLEILHRIVRSGGIWINNGPLLFHWEDAADPRELSIEMDWTGLRKLIEAVGFEIEREEWIETTYAANRQSMLQYVYRCVFLVARRMP
ncbi:hypothetical protein AMAG_11983 [Allomyces macrogynus ATCC 38327]|uniref:carnosine N-methyltransferase n=1 Tax=Allomyces macrogynus (strain ATCC 38327) TaxID=578462 RepID=A0A0L0SYC4_ALLM3|nr:hypothetical protein AMAG_11983 [Allomyces macrogynus ATCC 38327]|eukprot:KNE67528.1 hypothetical protein AMAG_11983 [Allomyces macrogynus ATCC 38327]